MHKYWGFGLHIISGMEFPELLPFEFKHADVSITLGEVPDINVDIAFDIGHISYQLNDHELVFSVQDVASYYVADGNRIIVHPHPANTEERAVRLFVLGAAIAGILQQRRQVPLHTSAVVVNDRLTLIAGQSGAGKSTTLAGLKQRQYRIFSDDITVLKELPDDDRISGVASYPMIKLWEHSLQTLQLNDRSFPVMPGFEKYGFFFHGAFDTRQYPIERIILLETGETDTIRHKQLRGSVAFAGVVQHVYKASFFRQPAMRALCFDVISKMVKCAEVYQVTRPAQCAPDSLLDVVTSIF
ncbi:phosphoenolpyruvate carboxykinase (ATP) [Chitinophaga ginsengisoli]|uniref:Hpr(Ser) kinase/phosphatase n=1 Tax=Chitinophaga ginsengisoli TaxID=363837 RepID=A0A2P8GL56_9BACT|nr:hypothetical protein [Chitinophaga ginsengisoli]PSL34703.1 hypothetical protein CLV42_102276 [Chitinophaga ginsengisoli]